MDKVIFTDLDGTLFYPKKRIGMIPKESIRFIRRFIDDGGRLVIVSSRGPAFAAKVEEKIDRKIDCIGCNGTFVMSEDRLIHYKPFEAKELLGLISDLRREYNPKMFILTTLRHPLIMPKTKTGKFALFGYFCYSTTQGVYTEKKIRSDQLFYSEINKGAGLKLMVLIGITAKHKALAERIAARLRNKYPDYDISWLGEFIEITPKGCNKATGVSFYLDYNHINKDNVIVIGDSGNDVSMFEAFHEGSYAMSHGPDSVKAKARYVVDRFADLEKVLYPSADSKKAEKEGKK